MSKVEEYKLVDITLGIHTGLNPRKNFKLNTFDAQFYYVTVKEIASNKVVFSNNTDKINAEAWSVIQNRSHLSKGDVLFTGIGTIGKVAYVNDNPKNWNCSESVYIIKPFNGLLGKYLYYILQTNKVISQYEANSAGSIMKGVRKANLEQIKIPLPHIKVQEEIVEVLDSFTNLIDALNEELSLRQKQFEYYREKLLTFDDNINCVYVNPMRGKRVVKSELDDKNKYPVYQNSIEALGYYDKVNRRGNLTFVICAGAAGEIGYSYTDFWAADDCFTIEHNNLLDKYVYYYLYNKKSYLKSQVRKASVPRLSNTVISNLSFPCPSLSIQQSIVEKLDAFESLISSLKEEIALRQKQYEYYREKLLTFD